jgi:hypothetical protein
MPHLRLTGITRLSLLGSRGPKDAFLFDPHRLALPSWQLALEGLPKATLLTLDRHFDLVPPAAPHAFPDRAAGLRAIDEATRWELSERNTDHVLAAMEAGLVGDVIAVARAHPKGALAGETYVDRRGEVHRILRAPTVERIAEGFGTREAGPWAQEAQELLRPDRPLLLDIDLDCFTTASDADPMELLPWPQEIIRRFLLPEGSEPFWSEALSRCVALTFAREPYHCGGVLAAGRLFEAAAPIVFQELLGADLP